MRAFLHCPYLPVATAVAVAAAATDCSQGTQTLSPKGTFRMQIFFSCECVLSVAVTFTWECRCFILTRVKTHFYGTAFSYSLIGAKTYNKAMTRRSNWVYIFVRPLTDCVTG